MAGAHIKDQMVPLFSETINRKIRRPKSCQSTQIIDQVHKNLNLCKVEKKIKE